MKLWENDSMKNVGRHPLIMQSTSASCYKDLHVNRPKLPAQAVAKGLQLTPIPEELSSSNDSEWEFTSLHIPFRKFIALPKGKQCMSHV